MLMGLALGERILRISYQKILDENDLDELRSLFSLQVAVYEYVHLPLHPVPLSKHDRLETNNPTVRRRTVVAILRPSSLGCWTLAIYSHVAQHGDPTRRSSLI